MKTKLTLLILVILCMASNSFSYDLKIDGIYYFYHYHHEDNIGMVCDGVTVTFGDTPYTGNIVIPAFVSLDDTDYKVLSIGLCAFRGNEQLLSVELSENINIIDKEAFLGCSSLESIVIPNSVTSINDRAFWGCENLKSITIGDAVRYVGTGAFTYCNALEKVIIHDLESWCQIDWAKEYYQSSIFYCSQPLQHAHHLYLEVGCSI